MVFLPLALSSTLPSDALRSQSDPFLNKSHSGFPEHTEQTWRGAALQTTTEDQGLQEGTIRTSKKKPLTLSMAGKCQSSSGAPIPGDRTMLPAPGKTKKPFFPLVFWFQDHSPTPTGFQTVVAIAKAQWNSKKCKCIKRRCKFLNRRGADSASEPNHKS